MVHRITERIGIVALAVGLVGVGVGCNQTASPEQCKKLLEHVINLQVKDAGESKDMRPEMQKTLETQKQKLTSFVREDFMKNCVEELPAGFVSCALRSKTTAAYADCTKDN